MPDETSAYLAAAEPANTFAIGDSAAAAYPEAGTIYAGGSEVATSVAVAEAAFTDPTLVGIAREDDFADALAGSALVGHPSIGPGPLLLTDQSELSGEVETYLTDNSASIEAVAIFGGPVAISQDVEDAIAATQE